jgi:hypothetical protein
MTESLTMPAARAKLSAVRLLAPLAVSGAMLLASCAALLGPRTVDLPLSQLQEAMARKFPFNNRYLELFDISLTNPRLALQPDTNRVVTTLDASISPPFIRQPWKGSVTLSGMLTLDPERRAVVLAEPRLERFNVDGMDRNLLDHPYAGQLGRIGRLLAEQLLDGMPIYTFGPDDFRIAGTRFLPTRINTKADGLVVTFEPVR